MHRHGLRPSRAPTLFPIAWAAKHQRLEQHRRAGNKRMIHSEKDSAHARATYVLFCHVPFVLLHPFSPTRDVLAWNRDVILAEIISAHPTGEHFIAHAQLLKIPAAVVATAGAPRGKASAARGGPHQGKCAPCARWGGSCPLLPAGGRGRGGRGR